MSWQDIGVIVVVGAAAYFLARKFLAPPARKKPASFVPLASLKKTPKPR